jgi:hypothetical protein
MVQVASQTPHLAGEAARRCVAALDRLRSPGAFEVSQARAQFSAMIAAT